MITATKPLPTAPDLVRVLLPDTTRTTSGLSICPACKFSAHHGITPHLCITAGDQRGQTLAQITSRYGSTFTKPLMDQLAAHPAQPLATVAEGELLRLRAVDHTWCVCAHSATTPAAGPDGASS